MKTNYFIGQSVVLAVNPNPVEVVYIIRDIQVYVEYTAVKAIAELEVARDYDLPDGGKITPGNRREENVLQLKPWLSQQDLV
ncbi:hypothetical protein [Spirosoma sp.]|uniref:hypothetical protein n=1 Tax=Spirosoma sp. TaxID=1899569 RepID=UPI002607781E|nr:hypothetical protein [Spirosoma sp.]MCX6217665.1 hypothetical protein [Spirosoma sp.]